MKLNEYFRKKVKYGFAVKTNIHVSQKRLKTSNCLDRLHNSKQALNTPRALQGNAPCIQNTLGINFAQVVCLVIEHVSPKKRTHRSSVH